MPRPPADPYAPPPMHHDRSGAIVRIAILAVLLAGVGFGWMYFSSHQQSAGLVAPAADEQQLADNSDQQVYHTNPAIAAPEAAPQAPAPTPQAPPPRRAATQRPAPVHTPTESVPPPTTSTTPPVDSTAPLSPPTPLPPSDQGE
jgi:hypothetical protein